MPATNLHENEYSRVLQRAQESMLLMDIVINAVVECGECSGINGKKITLREALERCPAPLQNCVNKGCFQCTITMEPARESNGDIIWNRKRLARQGSLTTASKRKPD